MRQPAPEGAVNHSAKDLDSMLCIQHIHPQNTPVEIETAAVRALAQSGRAHQASDLRDFFAYVDTHGGMLCRTLAAGIDELQELVHKTVHAALAATGVEVDARLTLRLTAQGTLVVETACAGQEQAVEILAASRVLPALLKELSVRSAVLRDITELRLVADSRGTENDEKLSEVHQSYRVCLKGALSHFYNICK